MLALRSTRTPPKRLWPFKSLIGGRPTSRNQMGPIPPESTLKDGIVAVAKRVRDPLEKEKSPSLKRPHILTPSSIENSMTTSQTSNSFSLPQNLAPIIL